MSIHQESFSSPRRAASFGACLAISSLLFLAGNGSAQIVSLTSGGSTAAVDLGSSAGMYNWTVNGQDQLNQQWFWYQANGGAVQPINTIANPSVLNGGLSYTLASPNQLDAYYYNDQLSIDVLYTLKGGGVGSGGADITEQIMVINQSSSVLSLNFYQYSNFNLLGAANDNVEIFNSGGKYNSVRQWNGSTAIEETVASPSADYAEAAYYSLSGFNPSPSGPLNNNLTAGPGNVTWAFEWCSTLAANGGEFDLTKDKSLSIAVVPEPGTTAAAVFGGLCLMGWTARRRRSAS